MQISLYIFHEETNKDFYRARRAGHSNHRTGSTRTHHLRLHQLEHLLGRSLHKELGVRNYACSESGHSGRGCRRHLWDMRIKVKASLHFPDNSHLFYADLSWNRGRPIDTAWRILQRRLRDLHKLTNTIR